MRSASHTPFWVPKGAKFEARNRKQIPRTKTQRLKNVQAHVEGGVSVIRASCLFRVSCFGFRIFRRAPGAPGDGGKRVLAGRKSTAYNGPETDAGKEAQVLYYTVFRTKWGHFGLAGTGEAVCRTYLPAARRETAERGLLLGLTSTGRPLRRDRAFLRDLQERIIAYYEGEAVDFRTDPPLRLDPMSPFGRRVLRACRKIRFGQTTTYSELARQIDRPEAVRAVGGVMAANPTALIIPCHRVLRADGGLGGFSAPGGTATKHKMLRHEQKTLCE